MNIARRLLAVPAGSATKNTLQVSFFLKKDSNEQADKEAEAGIWYPWILHVRLGGWEKDKCS